MAVARTLFTVRQQQQEKPLTSVASQSSVKGNQDNQGNQETTSPPR